MARSKSTTAAALLQFVWSACLIVLSFPALANGATSQAGGILGYLVTVLGFSVAILGIVAAYGTWMNMRRGKILGIVVNVFLGLFLLGAMLFASPPVKLMAGALLLIPILIIVLLLQRTHKIAPV